MNEIVISDSQKIQLFKKANLIPLRGTDLEVYKAGKPLQTSIRETGEEPIRAVMLAFIFKAIKAYSKEGWDNDQYNLTIDAIIERFGIYKIESILKFLQGVSFGMIKRTQKGHILPGELLELVENHLDHLAEHHASEHAKKHREEEKKKWTPQEYHDLVVSGMKKRKDEIRENNDEDYRDWKNKYLSKNMKKRENKVTK